MIQNPPRDDASNPPNPPFLREGEEGLSFSVEVSHKDQGMRLDQFLAGTEINLSRSQVKKLVEEEFILLNGKPTKPSTHVKAGDQISGTLPSPKPLSIEPESLPLTILYEDPSIIVIDKPAGMVV